MRVEQYSNEGCDQYKGALWFLWFPGNFLRRPFTLEPVNHDFQKQNWLLTPVSEASHELKPFPVSGGRVVFEASLRRGGTEGGE